jgi:hypothetical protein
MGVRAMLARRAPAIDLAHQPGGMAMTAAAPRGLAPRDLDEAFALAERLAGSHLLPVHLEGRPVDIYTTILTGMELGLLPMAAIRGFFLNDGGELCLLADTMVAIVAASPVCEYVFPVETTGQRATWETKRRGHHQPIKYSWTIEQQRSVGWAPGSMWDTDPLSMLSARAKARLVRNVYPDLLAGFVAAEELPVASPAAAPAVSREQTISAVAATVASAAAPPDPTDPDHAEEVAAIRASLLAAQDEDAVKKLFASLAKKPPSVRSAIMEYAQQRLAQVRRDARAASEVRP